MTAAAIKGDPARTGNWMQTFTGGEFYPMDPRPEDVHIKDIAGALSKVCRYGGHSLRFYSVAGHCVHVARLAPDKFKLTALLHDASEAYICDIPRPFKPFLTNYYAAENKVMLAIADRFGIEWPLPTEVKALDEAILLSERDQIMALPPRDWGIAGKPLNVDIQCWYPDVAYVQFMEAFNEYGGK